MYPENEDNYVRNYLTERTKNFSFELIFDEIRQKHILASLEKHRPLDILEVGCGLVPLFKYYEKYRKYVIVEPRNTFLDFAVKTAKESGKNIIPINEAIENADLTEVKPFDFIIISSLLHEVHDPNKLLGKINSICNGKTIVVINVPNAYSFHRLLAVECGFINSIFEPSDRDVLFHRYNRFTKETLCELLNKNGFTVIESWTSFIKIFDNKKLEECLRYGIIDEGIIEGFEKMTKYMPDMGCELFVEARRADDPISRS